MFFHSFGNLFKKKKEIIKEDLSRFLFDMTFSIYICIIIGIIWHIMANVVVIIMMAATSLMIQMISVVMLIMMMIMMLMMVIISIVIIDSRFVRVIDVV